MHQPEPLDLDAIETRANAATPGPWEEHADYGPHFYAYLRGPYLRGVGTLNFGEGEEADADREFVKHAREDVPALVAEVRRLRARVTDLERPAVGPDTLPAWLRQRFTASGVNWEHLDDTERSYWEHQARAVRRAVARNGFKTAEETHVVADGSDDPEHIDGCPGCEARPVPAATEEQQ